VTEKFGTGFVGPFEDDKVSEILKLPQYVRPIGYPKETEPVERLEGLPIEDLLHYEG
jgi:nitroreductase